jgi:polysaccharide biosynthesis protein PslG
MPRCRLLPWLLLTLAAVPLTSRAQAPGAQADTGITVSDRLGVGIHFITPQLGEIGALRDTGARWVRKDLDWASTEKAPGVYDFSQYDALLSQLESAGLRTLLILCYYNPLYDHGLSPASDDARQAFARWAAAAVTHFRGHHILWEIYNEPNFRFWTPRPNTEDYIKLALAVGEAVHEAAPDEKLVGPAAAGMDLSFVEACLKAGLLNYWSAVSVHVYTPGDPEGVASDLLHARLLMRKYMPPGKSIPVIITEWGYSAVWNGMDEQKQAAMLARGWLTQIANDEPLSFWYDWESGGNSQDPEQHFGLIGPPLAAVGAVTLPKKPSYLAAQTLTRLLGDFKFNKRLVLDKPEDYVLLFTRGKETRLAVWTAATPHQAALPASAGSFEVTGVTGESLASLVADRGLDVMLTNGPQYLVPADTNDLLRVAAAWQRLPTDIEVRSPGELTLHLPIRNPLSKNIRFRIGLVDTNSGMTSEAHPGQTARLAVPLQVVTRSADPVTVAVGLRVGGIGRLEQSTLLVAENPLRATVLPLTPTSLPVLITNPAHDGFSGSLVIKGGKGIGLRSDSAPVHLTAGSNDVTVALPIERAPESYYEVGVSLVDEDRRTVLKVPVSGFAALSNLSNYAPAAPLSGEKPESSGSQAGGSGIAQGLPPEGPPEPGMTALRLTLKLPPGGSSVSVTSPNPAATAIPGQPKALGLWIYGDDSRAVPCIAFVDSSGQRFEDVGGPINWKGWRYVLVLMDAPQAAHSGGPNDGVIHYPIRWDNPVWLRNPSNQPIAVSLYLSGRTLIYGPAIPALTGNKTRR